MASVPAKWFVLVSVIAFGAVVFGIVEALAVSHLSYRYSNLWYAYSEVSSEYNKLEVNYISLAQSYNEVTARYLSCVSDLNSTLQDLNWALNEVNKYRVMIPWIYHWLYENNEMNEGVFQDQISGCVHDNVINYPCVVFVHNYSYLPDLNGDHAEPYWQFIQRGGGDCEDFAIYAAALIRRAMHDGYKVRFFENGPGIFWITSRWYYPSSRALDISPRSVSVVCGIPSEDANYQHCVIYVCGDNNCYFVEPQDGSVYDKPPFVSTTIILTGNDIIYYGTTLSQVEVDLNGRLH